LDKRFTKVRTYLLEHWNITQVQSGKFVFMRNRRVYERTPLRLMNAYGGIEDCNIQLFKSMKSQENLPNVVPNSRFETGDLEPMLRSVYDDPSGEKELIKSLLSSQVDLTDLVQGLICLGIRKDDTVENIERLVIKILTALLISPSVPLNEYLEAAIVYRLVLALPSSKSSAVEALATIYTKINSLSRFLAILHYTIDEHEAQSVLTLVQKHLFTMRNRTSNPQPPLKKTIRLPPITSPPVKCKQSSEELSTKLVDALHEEKRSVILKTVLQKIEEISEHSSDSPLWDYALRGVCSHLGSSDRFIREAAIEALKSICRETSKPRSSLLVLISVLNNKMKSEAIIVCLNHVLELIERVQISRNVKEKLAAVCLKYSNDANLNVRKAITTLQQSF
jgi:hypothetical protein